MAGGALTASNVDHLGALETWLHRLPAERPTAVVLGGQANGLSYLRSLGRRNVPTVMLAGSDPGSRYGRTLEMPDAVRFPERWLEVLHRIGASLPTPGVLIPTSDPLVLLVARHAVELEGEFRFVVPSAEVVGAIVNKKAQYERAQAAGIPIPETHFPTSSGELRQLAAVYSYPRLLKPYQSHLSKQAMGAKAIIAHDADELIAAYERHADSHDLMVQDLVPGDDATLFGYVAFWDPVGCEHSWFTRQKLRQYPTGIGNGSLQVTVEAPEVADLGRRLIQSYDYRGPVAVEFRWDERDGSYRLIEINARSGASNQLGITAGVDVPWIVYRTAVGPPGDRVPIAHAQVGVKWMYEELDFRAYRVLRQTEGWTLRRWLATLRGVRSWALWSPRDPKPLLLKLSALVRSSAGRRRGRGHPSGPASVDA